MRFLATLVVLCGVTTAIGWFMRGSLDHKKFVASVAKADTLQKQIDSTQIRLKFSEDSLKRAQVAAAKLESEMHLAIYKLATRELQIVDSIKAVPNVPQTVIDFVVDLQSAQKKERAKWVAANDLLTGQYMAEHMLRVRADSLLLSVTQENKQLRDAIAAKPNQVVLTNSKFWQKTTIALALVSTGLALRHH